MSWRSVFSNLASLAVSGVATSYDLDDLPPVLASADLPALVPAFPAGVGMIGEEEQGLAALTYDGSAWLAALHADHFLYWSPEGAGAGPAEALPALLDAVDAYLAALSADGTLGGALHAPLAVERVQVGVFEYGGAAYFGARFRHRWVRLVE
jgi:hypothetical protein